MDCCRNRSVSWLRHLFSDRQFSLLKPVLLGLLNGDPAVLIGWVAAPLLVIVVMLKRDSAEIRALNPGTYLRQPH